MTSFYYELKNEISGAWIQRPWGSKHLPIFTETVTVASSDNPYIHRFARDCTRVYIKWLRENVSDFEVKMQFCAGVVIVEICLPNDSEAIQFKLVEL